MNKSKSGNLSELNYCKKNIRKKIYGEKEEKGGGGFFGEQRKKKDEKEREKG